MSFVIDNDVLSFFYYYKDLCISFKIFNAGKQNITFKANLCNTFPYQSMYIYACIQSQEVRKLEVMFPFKQDGLVQLSEVNLFKWVFYFSSTHFIVFCLIIIG